MQIVSTSCNHAIPPLHPAVITKPWAPLAIRCHHSKFVDHTHTVPETNHDAALRIVVRPSSPRLCTLNESHDFITTPTPFYIAVPSPPSALFYCVHSDKLHISSAVVGK